MSVDEIDGHVVDRIGNASNVLVLCPTMHDTEASICTDLLTVDDPDDENVLSVSYTVSPRERNERWRRYVGEEHPAERCLIDVGETTRRPDRNDTPVPDKAVETVSDPADLTGLGVRLTEALKHWHDNDNRTVLCFHSLTALLQYTDVQRIFRFLHVLAGRLTSRDAVGHYHLDPTVCDDRTLNTFKTLFDAVVRVDDDGPTVRTR